MGSALFFAISMAYLRSSAS